MIIDTSVYLSRWPFRRVEGDEPAELVAHLRGRGVTQAWAGSYDGILHKDMGGVNARLADSCETYGRGFLVPFGSVNPMLPDWREDLRRCHEQYRMPGIRLHPNYHGYTLQDPVCGEALSLAAARGLLVQLVVQMEDDRTQHPLMKVPPVDMQPLPALVSARPGLRIQVLNGIRALRPAQVKPIVAAGQVYFDFAMLDGIGAVAALAAAIGEDRVLFGSHFPYYYFESAALKVREAGLTPGQTDRILAGNASALLKAKP